MKDKLKEVVEYLDTLAQFPNVRLISDCVVKFTGEYYCKICKQKISCKFYNIQGIQLTSIQVHDIIHHDKEFDNKLKNILLNYKILNIDKEKIKQLDYKLNLIATNNGYISLPHL